MDTAMQQMHAWHREKKNQILFFFFKAKRKRKTGSPSGFRPNNFVASINDLVETRAPEMVSVTEFGYWMMRSSAHLS